MAKRKDKQSETDASNSPDPAAPTEIEAASAEAGASPAETSASAQPAAETGTDFTMAICPQIDDAPSIAPGDDVLKAEIAKVMAASDEPASAEIGTASAENITPITNALIHWDKVIDAQSPRRHSFGRLRARRLTRLAATVAIAAAVGAVAGSLSTLAVSGRAASTNDDTRASRADVARLDQELAALKSGMETSRKTAGAQLARVTERLDRAERTQSEPAARLSKLSEAVERLERRSAAPVATFTTAGAPSISAPSTVAASGDITGSIPTPTPRPAPQSEANALPKPPVVEGWTVRNVYDGIALVQGRFGLIEVEPGDMVPGIGRIDTIRRQDGRWVVVTSKGLIVQR